MTGWKIDVSNPSVVLGSTVCSVSVWFSSSRVSLLIDLVSYTKWDLEKNKIFLGYVRNSVENLLLTFDISSD